MSNNLISVVIPTHNHGPLIEFAIRSLLDQTNRNFDVIIIGDGIPEEYLACVQELSKLDTRITLKTFPKGERHGELNRHEVINNLNSKYVVYLSDDDIVFPNFIATTLEYLADYDFVSAENLKILPDGTLKVYPGQIQDPNWKYFLQYQSHERRYVSEINTAQFIGLTATAHSMDAYRRLPYGWRTTPEKHWIDLYMWRQFLELPNLKAITYSKPVYINFPESFRNSLSNKERYQELEQWFKKSREPGYYDLFVADKQNAQAQGYRDSILSLLYKESDWLSERNSRVELQAHLKKLDSEIAEQQSGILKLLAELSQEREEKQQLQAHLKKLDLEIADLRERLTKYTA